jgi:hypothetical protein
MCHSDDGDGSVEILGLDLLDLCSCRPGTPAGWFGSPPDEFLDAPLQFRPGHQDVPAASRASDADVRAEADNFPPVAAAGVNPAGPDDITDQQFEDGHANRYLRSGARISVGA